MFDGFKEDDAPMAIMCSVIGSLSTFLVEKDKKSWTR